MAAAPRDLEELALYEGLRRGRGRAFRRLQQLHARPMLRVAGWYVADPSEARRLVVWTWLTALNGLSMFTWHSTFRAWLFGILVGAGRTRAAGHAVAPPASVQPPVSPAAAPLDWADLAWSPHWSPASWAALQSAIAGLPLPEQEVLRLRDIEGWTAREACDTLGLTQSEERRLLHAGRTTLSEWLRLHLGAQPCGGSCAQPALRVTDHLEGDTAAFAAHVQRCPTCTCRVLRIRGLVATLHLLAPDEPSGPPDPELMAAFQRWRAGRRLRPWHRLPLVKA